MDVGMGLPFETRSEIESRKQRLVRLHFGTIGTHLLRNADHLSFGFCTVILVLGLQRMIGIVVHHHCPTSRSVTSIVLSPQRHLDQHDSFLVKSG